VKPGEKVGAYGTRAFQIAGPCGSEAGRPGNDHVNAACGLGETSIMEAKRRLALNRTRAMLAGIKPVHAVERRQHPLDTTQRKAFTCLSIHHNGFSGECHGRKVQRAAMFMQKAEKRFPIAERRARRANSSAKRFSQGCQKSVAIPGSFPEGTQKLIRSSTIIFGSWGPGNSWQCSCESKDIIPVLGGCPSHQVFPRQPCACSD